MWGYGSGPHLWAAWTPSPLSGRNETPPTPLPPSSFFFFYLKLLPTSSHSTPYSRVPLAAHILSSPEQHSAPAGCVVISILYPPQPPPHSSSSTFSDPVHLPHRQPGTSQSPTVPSRTPCPPRFFKDPSDLREAQTSLYASDPSCVLRLPQSLTGPPSPSQDPHSPLMRNPAAIHISGWGSSCAPMPSLKTGE